MQFILGDGWLWLALMMVIVSNHGASGKWKSPRSHLLRSAAVCEASAALRKMRMRAGKGNPGNEPFSPATRTSVPSGASASFPL